MNDKLRAGWKGIYGWVRGYQKIVLKESKQNIKLFGGITRVQFFPYTATPQKIKIALT